MFYLQGFRGALLVFPVRIVFSAVMWAEWDVCCHTTTLMQRDTVLPSFEHVLISFRAFLLQSWAAFKNSGTFHFPLWPMKPLVSASTCTPVSEWFYAQWQVQCKQAPLWFFKEYFPCYYSSFKMLQIKAWWHSTISWWPASFTFTHTKLLLNVGN